MTSIITRKIGMTQIIGKDGTVKAVSLLSVPINIVTDIRTQDRDGYSSTQIGISVSKKSSNAVVAKNKKNKVDKNINLFREATLMPNKNIGDAVELNEFNVGDKINAIGIGKGKGFSGTVKRHKFTIGPKSHGSHNMRSPGSIGSAYPQRVVKGRKMPGRMGVQRTTIKNLTLESIDSERRLISVSGNVPGIINSVILIKKING